MLALAEFSVELILREGLDEFKDSDIDLRLTDIFGRLKIGLLNAKYGQTEIDKIKKVLLKSEIGFVHSFSQLAAKGAIFPSISIELNGDTEDEAKAAFDDLACTQETPIDPAVVVPTFTASSYNTTTGKVSVPDSVNLSDVYEGRFWEEGTGISFKVLDPISNILGDKFFHIDKMQTVDLNNTRIVSCVDQRVHEVKYIASNENILVGVHAQNALLTRYLYYIVRHILWTKKDRFRELNLMLSKYDGSGFKLNIPLLPEGTYSRFITTRFVAYNLYRDKEIVPIDAIQPSMGGAGAFENIIPSITPVTYDPDTGIVTIPDAIDLSIIILGRDYFFDTVGTKSKITAFDNSTGSKTVKIKLGETIDTSGVTSIRRAYRLRVEAESERENEIDFEWETDVKDDE